MKYADIKTLPNKELVERYKEEKKTVDENEISEYRCSN